VIEEALAARPDVQVVGSVWSGEKALKIARDSLPDFVTLDIEMPGIGGIETLRALRDLAQAQKRPLGILVISSYTHRGAAITVEALEEGAFDFTPKPAGADPQANASVLRKQLYEKIDAFKSSHRVDFSTSIAKPHSKPMVRTLTRYRAVVIATSTGGPEALA